MVASRVDYGRDEVEAARSVLVELIHLLGEYRDNIVVVGGWVPELLFHDSRVPHVGSMDIDLAMDHRALQDAGYKTILRLLLARGYRQGPQPFIFYRSVRRGDRDIVVEVDLLAGEYQGTGKGHRTQAVRDTRARKARGCDLAFDMSTDVTITGELPEGGQDSVVARVAGIVPFLAMKAMALRDRLKEKDAWDIYYCIRYYPGGLDALIEAIRPHVGHGLVREGLLIIKEKFASPDHIGPRFVADFDGLEDTEDRAMTQQDAYQRVAYLLGRLGIG